jgi:hypothetical protein
LLYIPPQSTSFDQDSGCGERREAYTTERGGALLYEKGLGLEIDGSQGVHDISKEDKQAFPPFGPE